METEKKQPQLTDETAIAFDRHVIDRAFSNLVSIFGNEHLARLCAIKVKSTLELIRINDRIVTDEEVADWEQLSKHGL